MELRNVKSVILSGQVESESHGLRKIRLGSEMCYAHFEISKEDKLSINILTKPTVHSDPENQNKLFIGATSWFFPFVCRAIF